MAAVGWTGFMLFLLLNISMGKETKQSTVSCEVGQNATLPCKDTLSDCSMVTWVFSQNTSPAIGLVEHGKVKDTQRPGRLTLGSDCSLWIKNLNTEDAGRYICRLYHNNKDFTDISAVSLFVGENRGYFTPAGSPSTVSPTSVGNKTIVAVAASCVAVCVGVCIAIVIILIYKRRQDNQHSSCQVKVPETNSLTYTVVDFKNSKQNESNRKTDYISTEYATIRTTQ